MILGIRLVNKLIHVFIAIFICLVNLEVQQLAMINSEATVKSPHANHFINHIQSVVGNFSTDILVSYDVSNLLVLGTFQIDKWFWVSFALLSCIFLLYMFVYQVFCLHESVEVFVDNLVGSGGLVASLKVDKLLGERFL